MNKLLLTMMIVALAILGGCQEQAQDSSTVSPSEETGCTYDDAQKSYVGKSLDECSRIKFMCIQGTEYFSDECGCGCAPVVQEAEANEDGKRYVPIPKDDCKASLYVCNERETPFFDDLGCGCETKKEDASGAPEGKIKVTDCTPEQRGAEICTLDYRPVCGWSDPAKIQCFTYPCASTYSNICQACADENVISWSEGECPKTESASY